MGPPTSQASSFINGSWEEVFDIALTSAWEHWGSDLDSNTSPLFISSVAWGGITGLGSLQIHLLKF